jgi:hypothetical protein
MFSSLRTCVGCALLFSPIALYAADPPKASPTKLEVFPAKIALAGPRDQQHIGVLARFADGTCRDVSQSARFTTGNAATVKVEEHGLAVPVADGTTTITVEVGGQTASVPVIVKQGKAEIVTSYVREVLPVLTKAGCNQGACHGSQHGRGGFKLSLFGFDPQFDHSQIVQSDKGRRVVVSDPERSILLLKPSLQMEHGGGERLKRGSRGYEIVKQWLEDGAPEPSANDVTVTAIEAWPAKRIMVPGESQQVLISATWSDGRREDVTATARFDALNDGIASVTPEGLVTAKAKGETHIMVRFGGQATVMQVTMPYGSLSVAHASGSLFAPNNLIDEKLVVKWRDLGLSPSGPCSDQEFLRRIYLDTIGTLPTPEEVMKFLADQDPKKREKAIDAVLQRPEYVDFWAYKWGDLLRINRTALEEKGMWSFHNWVRAELRDNKPVDEFVRDIILAEGSTFTDGPANFYRIGKNPEEWSETVTQVFLGVRIQCAKCHHHPFEKWSQDDYYGMTAFFVRLGTKNSPEFGLFGRESVIFLRPTGEATHPRKRAVVKPHVLDDAVSTPAKTDETLDRRILLAEWITSKDNALFARNIVNRFWGYLMGHGLVEPLDDMRATNPSSNPELLDALAKDFAEHHFDLKHLLKTLMLSRAYQLSSHKAPGNEADVSNTYFCRYTVKRLSAEQLADAVDFATGTREKYPGLPLGLRAIQLPDPEVRSFFMDTFGRPARQIVCECERTSKPNIAQAMVLLNDDSVNRKINDAQGRVAKLVQAKTTLPKMIEELYMVSLSRRPRPEELKRAEEYAGKAPNQREAMQDLLWVLLNSREFLFNH